jgi:hypothetical protein
MKKKNWKQNALIGMVAIIVLVFGFVGCPDKTPDPVPQTKTLANVTTIGGSVTVKINFKAVGTPSYMTTLETVIGNILEVTPNASGKTLTINVTADAADGGFVLASQNSKTLNVRESWISNATEQQIGESMAEVTISWIAMMGADKAFRLANVLPQGHVKVADTKFI